LISNVYIYLYFIIRPDPVTVCVIDGFPLTYILPLPESIPVRLNATVVNAFPEPEIVKCDMCFDRVSQGELPGCVSNCPAEALTFGTRRELISEARRRIVNDPDTYYDHIYGEHEAGGTGFLYLSPVPFNELGFKTGLQKSSYPELTKGFLYSVPSIFVLWPAILLGIHKATMNKTNEVEHE
jgi:hypothetical protein